MEQLKRFIKGEEGVTAMEYALIAAITCIVLALLMVAMRGNLSTIWQTISDALATGAGS